MKEHAVCLLVAVKDPSQEAMDALAQQISGLEGVKRVVGPVQGSFEVCDCPVCVAERAGQGPQ